MDQLPLRGVRVLDLSRVLAGPLCTMMLGDLGASVIKVERPGTGDDTRGWGPPFADDGQAAYFKSVNRNKLSIALDLRDINDQLVLRTLLADADVVIDNFLPRLLAGYSFDKGAELARNRRLIWCSISGFGLESDRPGYDFVAQAESGWMAITGPEAGPPMKAGVALVDVMTGKDATIAILGALAARERGTLSDRHLNISLMQSATAALINVAQNVAVSGVDAKRWGNAHPNLVPYQLFAAADRDIVIAVGTDAQWVVAMRALGLPALADDERLRANAGRLEHRAHIVLALSEQLRSQPASHWMDALLAARVPCGLVRSVREALVEIPASPETGVPPATGGTIRYAPPHLDEHGEKIRRDHWSVFDYLPILAQTDV